VGTAADGWVAVMAATVTMATMATSASTMTMLTKTMKTGRRCAFDTTRGIIGIGDGDMDATFVVSTTIKGNLFRTRLISLVTYLESAGL
jgi:hypothetical protein